MITITVSSMSEGKAASAEMAHRVLHDPNFNGAEYQIENGDWLSIEGCDEYAGAEVLSAITGRVQS